MLLVKRVFFFFVFDAGGFPSRSYLMRSVFDAGRFFIWAVFAVAPF